MRVQLVPRGAVSWGAALLRMPRRLRLAILSIALLGSGYLGYQVFGPTPYHTYWRFARAWSRGDRQAVFRMLARDTRHTRARGVPPETFEKFDAMMTEIEPFCPRRASIQRTARLNGLNAPVVFYEFESPDLVPAKGREAEALDQGLGTGFWRYGHVWKVDLYPFVESVCGYTGGSAAEEKWAQVYQRYAGPKSKPPPR